MKNNFMMLWWFNNEPSDAIKEAMAYHEKKYGTVPNFILMNEQQFDDTLTLENLELDCAKFVLKNNLFVGVRDANTPEHVAS